MKWLSPESRSAKGESCDKHKRPFTRSLSKRSRAAFSIFISMPHCRNKGGSYVERKWTIAKNNPLGSKICLEVATKRSSETTFRPCTSPKYINFIIMQHLMTAPKVGNSRLWLVVARARSRLHPCVPHHTPQPPPIVVTLRQPRAFGLVSTKSLTMARDAIR